jgi:ABC-2 type transport system permease protein
MLFYKAWLESRVRFLASGVVLAAYCVSFVEDARRVFPPVFEPQMPYSLFMWRGIYNGVDTLMFVVVALLLGLGGVQRERAAGTAVFTLALPTSRNRLLLPRVGMAVLQVTALAMIPALVVPLLSPRVGHTYPVGDAVKFAVLFSATGAVWVCAGIFWSSAIVSDVTGAIACILTPLIYGAVVNGTLLRRWPVLNIFNVMNGSQLPYVNVATGLFIGPFPWLAILVVLCVAGALVGASASMLTRTDF